MFTDGGDSVRVLVGVPILDWFHIAMPLTVLGQYTKVADRRQVVGRMYFNTNLDVSQRGQGKSGDLQDKRGVRRRSARSGSGLP